MRADARTRTADPFITSEVRGSFFSFFSDGCWLAHKMAHEGKKTCKSSCSK